MKTQNFLAFDIGATSGRAVLGTLEDLRFEMREINRFPNLLLELHGKYYWNIFQLYKDIKESLAICAGEGLEIDSIGIDTWGVDFGYLAADGSLLDLPRAYRDPYTEGAPAQYFERIPRQELYRLTGIQIMNFNSLFQLFRAKQEDFGLIEKADRILFMPDLLSYLLTGKMVCEYTDASTSQLLNPRTKEFEPSLFEAAGVSPSLVRPVVMPGTRIGELTDALAEETGLGKIPVIAVAGHDTASAVAAVPSPDREFAYLSSGTWSLMGIETEAPIITEASYHHNFTNEGGIEGTTRFLKNIPGMWLLEQCLKEWEQAGRCYSYPVVVQMAYHGYPFFSLIDVDDPRFVNPPSMTKAIAAYCSGSGQSVPVQDVDFIRCIFESLAFRYKEVLALLADMAPFPIRRLHVIGGGARNKLLNQFIANATQLPVVAGPAEASAVGNCMIQACAAGSVADRWEMRCLINDLTSPITFHPHDSDVWEAAYKHYQSVTLKG